MLSVNVICVGKLKEKYLRDALDEYRKRLSPLCRFCVTELPEEKAAAHPSNAQVQQIVLAESKRILEKIGKNDYVVALCVEGKNLSSEEFAQKIERISLDASAVDFIIGGSWGLSDALKTRADFRLSMGRMTFPHQLFRVMLAEQIYRAFQINLGTRYHK